MKRIVRLTESDLTRIVKRVISEQTQQTSLKGTDVGKFTWSLAPGGTPGAGTPKTADFTMGDKVEGGFFIVSKSNPNVKIKVLCNDAEIANVYLGEKVVGNMWQYNKGTIGTMNPPTGVRTYCSKMK